MTRSVPCLDVHDTLSVGDREVVVDQIVSHVLDVAGPGRVLAVGRGCAALLPALLDAGFDSFAIDEWHPEGPKTQSIFPPDRLRHGSMLSVPFSDAGFDSVIWTDVTAYADPAMLTPALRELFRICRGSAFLRLSAHLERERWETLLFDAGFRKHPNCFRVNSYEFLERPSPPITVVVEKLPGPAHDQGRTGTVNSGEGAVHDMLRTSGRESDVRLSRYQRAGTYVRPGDAVVDLASGCGDGLYVLSHNSPGKRFLGIDPRPCAIDYARSNFAGGSQILEFQARDALALLEAMPANSVDVVLGFDVPNDQADRARLLAQSKRALRPGGRMIVSVARGSGPSSQGIRAFSPDKIAELLGSQFLLEDLYLQNADPAGGGRWVRRAPWEHPPDAAGQWWIATAVRDPLTETTDVAYRETVFANLTAVRPVSTDYTKWYINPWVLHSMVHVGYRVKSPALLTDLARRLLAISPGDTADYGAALCILLYRVIGDLAPGPDLPALIDDVRSYLNVASANPHVRRWQISLTFALGQLHQKSGVLPEAIEFYRACAGMDATQFAVHLETKVSGSFFWWGWLALNQGDLREARVAWEGGVKLGNRLLNRPIDDVLMNPDYPNAFDHGDGMREFVLALENVTKCVNGIHALRRHDEGRAVDWGGVHCTFGARGDAVARELRAAQWKLSTVVGQLEEARHHLIARTDEAVAERKDLLIRTGELDAARNDLLRRTDELDVARRELLSRTAELDATRAELVDRTAQLDTARNDLVSRTAEVDAARQDLIARTLELDATRAELTEIKTQVNCWGARPVFRAMANLRRRWGPGKG
jgi:SAM-dependent methyltransferase